MIDMLFAHTAWAVQDRQEREACDAFLLDVFAAQTGFEILMSPDRQGLGLAREESLMVVGDTMLLPIAARSDGEGADADFVEMLTRHARDTMWIGIALRVKELKPVEQLFARLGLRCIYRPGMEHIYFVSDRDETLGMRFEILAQDLPNDPRLRPDWNPSWWRDYHPLGIEGSQSVGLSVASLDEARRFFCELGFPEVAQRYLKDEPADCAIFQVGEILVEAMCPTTVDSPLAHHLCDVQGQYCLTFKVKSLAAAANYLRGKGLTLLGDIDRRFLIDPAQAFSRRIYFTQEDIPGDPRATGTAVFVGGRA
jgi:catechol 2,3-dioxygenase-like lactoylglutathione lyase family enzyme